MFFSIGYTAANGYKYVMGPTLSGLAMNAAALPTGSGGTLHITNFTATSSGSAVSGTTTVYLQWKP